MRCAQLVLIGSFVPLVAVAACKVSGETFVTTDAGLEYTEVARFPATPNDDIDILFVVDDSPGNATVLAAMQAGLGTMLQTLLTPEKRFPNVHIGVVTTDLGVSGAYDPALGPTNGSGPGMCSGRGLDGVLRVGAATTLSGSFISDIYSSGTRTTNYTGPIQTTLENMLRVPSNGCEFEQPLEAARAALKNTTNNAGFLRANASLGIIFVTDEDDCSIRATSFFTDAALSPPPLTSFRCTRNGVICDYRGATPDEMSTPGVKASCHSNETGPLVPVSEYVQYFKSLKPDPNKVTVRSLAGPAHSLAVDVNSSGPYLVHLCASGIDADPAVRLDQVADGVSGRRTLDACAPSAVGYSDQLKSIALQLSGQTGHACLERPIPDGTDCIVETNGSQLFTCGTAPCYLRNASDASCPYGSIEVQAAAATAWITMRCRL
jgi:hypothetical protein